jgi:hypothetical protein
MRERPPGYTAGEKNLGEAGSMAAITALDGSSSPGAASSDIAEFHAIEAS